MNSANPDPKFAAKVQKKIDIMKEDQRNEWWKPSSIDSFSVKSKLDRVGCRPLKRNYLKCVKSMDMDPVTYSECSGLRKQLDECYKMLQYLKLIEAEESIED